MTIASITLFFFFQKDFDFFFFFFFISTSVQRQGVTDDFLELVPPHPFIHAFSFSLWLFFSSSLLFRAFFTPTHNK